VITRIPETVQQAWGDAIVRDFTTWLEVVMTDQTVGRDEWGTAVVRLTAVESRLAAVETRLGHIESEMADLRVAVDGMRDTFVNRFDRIYEHFDRLGARFDDRLDRSHELSAVQMRWTFGLFGLFGTLVALLVGIGQFVPK
jgi:hypothetical protein